MVSCPIVRGSLHPEGESLFGADLVPVHPDDRPYALERGVFRREVHVLPDIVIGQGLVREGLEELPGGEIADKVDGVIVEIGIDVVTARGIQPNNHPHVVVDGILQLLGCCGAGNEADVVSGTRRIDDLEDCRFRVGGNRRGEVDDRPLIVVMLVLEDAVVVKIGIGLEVSGQPDLDGCVLDVIRKGSTRTSRKGRVLSLCPDRGCPGIRGSGLSESVGVSVRGVGVPDNEKKARRRGRDIPGRS